MQDEKATLDTKKCKTLSNLSALPKYICTLESESKSENTKVTNRQNIHEFFMQQAFHWSTRSTCCKWMVGCVLVLEGRVISTGYNGVVSRAEHCCDFWLKEYLKSLEKWFDQDVGKLEDDKSRPVLNEDIEESFNKFLKSDMYRTAHREWSKYNEIHAEQNAILFAARHGHCTEGTSLYTSLSPCIECAKSIAAAGVSKVYYGRAKDLGGIKFLENNGISCVFIGLSGV